MKSKTGVLPGYELLTVQSYLDVETSFSSRKDVGRDSKSIWCQYINVHSFVRVHIWISSSFLV